jgi:exodeoxyribonuclease VII large subunit
MRRFVYDKLATPLLDGDRVHVQGKPQLRREGGRFAFMASRVDPYGLGNLLRDQELLRRRLAAEGLFAAGRKRPLPTSRTSSG